MISARLEYRLYVPYGTIAVTFAEINFFGDDCVVQKLKDLFRCIEFDKFDIYKKEIEKADIEILNNNQISSNICSEIEKIKSSKFWRLSSDNRQKIKDLTNSNIRINKDNELLHKQVDDLKKKRFYSASELRRRFNQMLSNLDFANKNITNDDNNINTEIYEYIKEDTKELINKIDYYTNLYKQKSKITKSNNLEVEELSK